MKKSLANHFDLLVTDIKGEEWKDLPMQGYQLSNKNRVKSFKKYSSKKEPYIMKQYVKVSNNTVNFCVNLTDSNNKEKWKRQIVFVVKSYPLSILSDLIKEEPSKSKKQVKKPVSSKTTDTVKKSKTVKKSVVKKNVKTENNSLSKK